MTIRSSEQHRRDQERLLTDSRQCFRDAVDDVCDEWESDDLYYAMKADRTASIVQLTCTVCGLNSWHEDCEDMALDFARDSDDEELIAEIAALPTEAEQEARALQWYWDHHRCEDHSIFSDEGKGFRDREALAKQLKEIEEALDD